MYVLWLIAKRAIAMRLFGLKASALQEATMEVHSVERDGEGRVVIELTIAPSTGRIWESDDIALTRSADHNPLDHMFEVVEREIQHGASFVADEGGKWPGPKTLRLTVQIPASVREVHVWYYTQPIGRVRIDG